MALECENGESVLKKTITAVFYTHTSRHITKLYVTDRRIILKNRAGEFIRLSFDQIHDISVEDGIKVSIRCNTPQRFFMEKEEHVRLYLQGLKRKEGNVIAILDDPRWAESWRKYLSSLVRRYQSMAARKTREMREEEEELIFIEGVQRRSNGLDPFAIVKNKEKLRIWFDSLELDTCTLYATGDHLLVKVKSADYLVIPYSVIYSTEPVSPGRICLTFSFPQDVDGFSQPLSRMCIERIPQPGEEYPDQKVEKWTEGWMEFFTRITSAFRARKGAISHDEMLEMLIEMKHSPTKYTLSPYAKQGWDRACGLAVERFGCMDDLYLFQNFLLQEYEEMKNRALAEPDRARQEAYSGSEMAYNAILSYITQHTRSR